MPDKNKKAERQELQNIGWQPYSVKVGDKYYSYGRLEPIATIVGMAADFSQIKDHMTEDEKYNVAAGIYGSIAANLKDKTFLTGLSNIIHLTDEPERYGKQVAEII